MHEARQGGNLHNKSLFNGFGAQDFLLQIRNDSPNRFRMSGYLSFTFGHGMPFKASGKGFLPESGQGQGWEVHNNGLYTLQATPPFSGGRRDRGIARYGNLKASWLYCPLAVAIAMYL